MANAGKEALLNKLKSGAPARPAATAFDNAEDGMPVPPPHQTEKEAPDTSDLEASGVPRGKAALLRRKAGPASQVASDGFDTERPGGPQTGPVTNDPFSSDEPPKAPAKGEPMESHTPEVPPVDDEFGDIFKGQAEHQEAPPASVAEAEPRATTETSGTSDGFSVSDAPTAPLPGFGRARAQFETPTTDPLKQEAPVIEPPEPESHAHAQVTPESGQREDATVSPMPAQGATQDQEGFKSRYGTKGRKKNSEVNKMNIVKANEGGVDGSPMEGMVRRLACMLIDKAADEGITVNDMKQEDIMPVWEYMKSKVQAQ